MEMRPRQLLGDHALRLARLGIWSFLGAMLLAGAMGIACSALSFVVLRDAAWPYPAIAIALPLVEAGMAGFFLGHKRGLASMMAYGALQLKLGRSLVRFLFERVLGVTDENEAGNRSGQFVHTLINSSLAKANSLLQERAEPEVAGMIPRIDLLGKLQRRLLGIVEPFALDRFRREQAEHGKIDLLRMKYELEETMDQVLADWVQVNSRYWTALVIFGLPLVVTVQTLVLLWLENRG